MFRCLSYQFILFFLKRFSSAACYKMAEIISDLQYLCSWKDRQNVRANLREIISSNENLAFHTREVFRNFGRYLVEFFQMNRFLNMSYIKRNVQIEGLEKIQKVLEQGRGGIFVSAHFGNWELGSAILSLLGYPSAVVALPHKQKFINDLFNRQRESKGISVIPVQKAPRQCIKVLKENKLVGIVADRDFNLRGKVMDFLGKKAIVPRGAAIFSYKTGAPIIPVFLQRNLNRTTQKIFKLSVKDPIFPSDFLKEEKEELIIHAIMKKYIKAIEEKIYQQPSQWLIFRKFWVE